MKRIKNASKIPIVGTLLAVLLFGNAFVVGAVPAGRPDRVDLRAAICRSTEYRPPS